MGKAASLVGLFLLFAWAALVQAATVTVHLRVPTPETLTLDLDEYVAGVLAGEAASFRSPASLDAMAVAARTYAIYHRGRHKAEGFDFCETTHCQDFRRDAITARLRESAQRTAGELLWFEGRPAATYYTKSCGGQRESAANVWPGLHAPYLNAQPDPHCGRDEWHRDLTFPSILQALLAAGLPAPAHLREIAVKSQTQNHRARELTLIGDGDHVPLAASSFRFALGRTLGWQTLPSDDYTLHTVNAHLKIDGLGTGHGVGLCQRGAAHMGEAEGATYQQILSFYYPGTKLGLTAQGLPWQTLTGERVAIQTTNPARDRALPALADKLLGEIEQETKQHAKQRPHVRIYPDVATFRDATGQPGWVAAITTGSTIDLQPAAANAPTLKHELTHVLLEGQRGPQTPLWFREGLVLALTNPTPVHTNSNPPEEATLNHNLRQPANQAARRQAYSSAQAAAELCLKRYGRASVLAWVANGLPPTLTYTSIIQATTSSK